MLVKDKDKDKKKATAAIIATVSNIEINIYTNIQGKENTPIPFTRTMFHDAINPNGLRLNDHPFFTTDYKISDSVLKYPFDARMRSFFEKNEFIKTLVEKDELFSQKPIYEKAEVNIKTLLKSLFPTYYPVPFNHTDSFSQMIERKLPNESHVSSFFSYFKEFFKPKGKPPNKKYEIYEEEYDIEQELEPTRHPFCYLDIDGTTYTVIKVVHLTDFINNPKYYEILKKFLEIVTWKKKQKQLNEIKIYKYKREIVDLTDRLVYDMNTLSKRYNFFANLHLSTSDPYRRRSNNTELINDIKKKTKKLFYSKYSYPPGSDKYFDTRSDPRKTNKTINEVFDECIQAANNPSVSTKVNELLKEINSTQSYDKIDSSNIGTIQKLFNELYAEIDKLITATPTSTSTSTLSTIKNTIETEIEPIILKTLESLKSIHKGAFKNSSTTIADAQPSIRKLERFKELTTSEESKYSSYKSEIDAKYNEYLEYIEFLAPLFRGDSNSSIIFDTNFTKSYNNILTLYNKLSLEIKIQDLYFGETTDITKDISEEVSEYFNTSHSKYSEFIQFIKKFVQPNRESSNTDVVNMILDYIVGNSKDLEDFLNKINEEDIDKIKSKLRISYEEHSKGTSDVPRYEIQVYMDLMKGKLTVDDVKKLGCYFKDKELVGTYYNRLYKNITGNAFLFNDKWPVIAVPKKKGEVTDSINTEKTDRVSTDTTPTVGGSYRKYSKCTNRGVNDELCKKRVKTCRKRYVCKKSRKRKN